MKYYWVGSRRNTVNHGQIIIHAGYRESDFIKFDMLNNADTVSVYEGTFKQIQTLAMYRDLRVDVEVKKKVREEILAEMKRLK